MARKAVASVSRLEAAISRAPDDVGLQINLAAKQKLSRQLQEKLREIAAIERVEVCDYRLIPVATTKYALAAISRSMMEFQYLFSQIYDSFRNGIKQRTRIGADAFEESALEFAYSYSGSLGVVLLAPSERDFFEGRLDRSIDALFQVVQIGTRGDVRQVAETYGNAVVKRVHDWSRANIDGGFATDVRWVRSDGRQIGQMIERSQLEQIVELIVATSDEVTTEHAVTGTLIGGDLTSRAFHFVVPHGGDYRGYLAQSFNPDTELTLGKQYRAIIIETSRTVYATERTETNYELTALSAPIP